METSWESIDKLPSIEWDGVKDIRVDTRDFHFIAHDGLPVIGQRGKELNFALETHSPSSVFIDKDEIYGWLDTLHKKTSDYMREHGYLEDDDWRCLSADLNGCRDWDLKYIAFVRWNNSNEFVVCNDTYFPIDWNHVIDKINYKYL